MISRWWHRKGFGVQSPWAYTWMRDVLFEPLRYYAFDQLRQHYHHGHRSKRLRLMDEQMFRIVHTLKPDHIILCGNIRESTKAYINATHCKTTQKEWDGNSTADWNDITPNSSMLVYISTVTDADNTWDRLIRSGKVNEQTAVVIDHPDLAHTLLWEHIRTEGPAVVTFEMKERGIVFFDTSKTKQNFTC